MTELAIKVSLTFLRAEGTTGSILDLTNPATVVAIAGGADPASVLLTIAAIDGWGGNGAALTALYREVLGRDPDVNGFRFWIDYGHGFDFAQTGKVPSAITDATMRDIALKFVGSPEGVAHGATAAQAQLALSHLTQHSSDGLHYAMADALRVSFSQIGTGNDVQIVGHLLEQSPIWA
jgi:hypothetical protein